MLMRFAARMPYIHTFADVCIIPDLQSFSKSTAVAVRACLIQLYPVFWPVGFRQRFIYCARRIMNSLPRLTRISASLALIFALAACGGKSDAPAAPPPPEVSVITVNPTKLAVTNELPARLESSRIAEVRARVPGIILKRNFHEGSDVKAGELLYQIDPAQFRADYNSANAAVERAEAILLQNELKAKRYKPLVETNAIS